MAPPPLTPGHIDRCADHHDPVWTCGDNWLRDNDEAADVLLGAVWLPGLSVRV